MKKKKKFPRILAQAPDIRVVEVSKNTPVLETRKIDAAGGDSWSTETLGVPLKDLLPLFRDIRAVPCSPCRSSHWLDYILVGGLVLAILAAVLTP